MAREFDFGTTGLWTRINCLNSPWMLDDVTEIVTNAGDKVDVIMLPKVEGPWDIHYLDQLLAQLEAKHKVTRSRSSFTPFSKRPKASTTSRPLRRRRRACTA